MKSFEKTTKEKTNTSSIANQLISSSLQKKSLPEEKMMQHKSKENTTKNPLITQLITNKTGLPDQLKSGIENLSGMSMDHVRVHYNSSQPAQLNALAYAQGSDIHIGPGQEKHLPHEAWHVVQQAQGRVRPTLQMKEGVPINDDPSLEKEADIMGGKAIQKMPGLPPIQLKKTNTQSPVIQAKLTFGSDFQAHHLTGIFTHRQPRGSIVPENRQTRLLTKAP